MSLYDQLKRDAEQARANGQKPFSATEYANASSQARNIMDDIASRKK